MKCDIEKCYNLFLNSNFSPRKKMDTIQYLQVFLSVHLAKYLQQKMFQTKVAVKN
jgi:hypothetical protein